MAERFGKFGEIDVMSTAEMKKEIIQKIEEVDDEVVLQKIIDIVTGFETKRHISEVYKELTDQYKTTLTRLAQ